MEDKKQDVKSLKELLKAANDFRKWAIDFGNELSKVLADIQASKKEEDTWKMKCPYKDGDEYWFVYDNVVDWEYWEDTSLETERFDAGNVFPTEEAALLEAKRRNLFARFKAFRDECNGDWKPNFSNNKEKYYLFYSTMEDCIKVGWTVLGCSFNNFGYFKNKTDAERAIKLFGDEIIELFVDCEG